jgi:hypothetical protein
LQTAAPRGQRNFSPCSRIQKAPLSSCCAKKPTHFFSLLSAPKSTTCELLRLEANAISLPALGSKKHNLRTAAQKSQRIFLLALGSKKRRFQVAAPRS